MSVPKGRLVTPAGIFRGPRVDMVRDLFWKVFLSGAYDWAISATERGSVIDAGANIGASIMRLHQNHPGRWILAYERMPMRSRI
jgi:hypothetical protein